MRYYTHNKINSIKSESFIAKNTVYANDIPKVLWVHDQPEPDTNFTVKIDRYNKTADLHENLEADIFCKYYVSLEYVGKEIALFSLHPDVNTSYVKYIRVDGGEWESPNEMTITVNMTGDVSLTSEVGPSEPIYEDTTCGSYTFSSEGIHTVEYMLYDKTKIGSNRGSIFSQDAIDKDPYISPQLLTGPTIPEISVDAAKLVYADLSKLDTLDALPVYCFYLCNSLDTIILPDNIRCLSESSFLGCSSLQNFTLPKKLGEIQGYCFCDCKNISHFDFPRGLYNIGNDAFSGTSIRHIDISQTLIQYIYGSFSSIYTLESIKLPSSLIEIDSSAFYDCISLKSITIPKNVIHIGYYAFYGCSSLKSITIPKNVTYIGDYAFSGTYFLKDNFINLSSLDAIKNNYWRANILSGDSYETEDGFIINSTTQTLLKYRNMNNDVIVPEGIKIINTSAFNNSTIRTIVLPSTLTKINDSAFANCKSLEYIEIPNSVTSIGYHAFASCESLTSFTIPDSVTSLGETVFWGCNNLDLHIGKGLTNIQNNKPYSCFGSVPSSITVSSENTGLKVVDGCLLSKDGTILYLAAPGFNIPDTVTTLWCSSLEKHTELRTIDFLSNNITAIGMWAFDEIYSIDTIIIPASVTTFFVSGVKGAIGDGAQTIIFEGDVPTAVECAVQYWSMNSNRKIIVPQQYYDNYMNVAWKYNEKDIIISQ